MCLHKTKSAVLYKQKETARREKYTANVDKSILSIRSSNLEQT